MLEGGENVKVVQERLGHASAKMNLDVYAKVVPGLQRETAVRMDSILSVNGDTRGGDTRRIKPHEKQGNPYHVKRGAVAQLVRAPACHAGGRRFEPVQRRQLEAPPRKGLRGFLISGPSLNVGALRGFVREFS
jgi:hypothetical protein